MPENFDRIKYMYERSFQEHGDSPASLLTPKGRQRQRFRAIDAFVSGPRRSVLDYGCGLGYLYDYLVSAGRDVAFTGVDIMPSFIEACRAKFGAAASFDVIDPVLPLAGQYDVVFSSGVFNIRVDRDDAVAKAYVHRKLKELFDVAGEVLVCDFLSSFVDYEQDDALHFSVGEIAQFAAQNLSRRMIIRHDLLPYEFTLIAWKDTAIKRPENMYQVDWLGAGE